MPRGRKPRNDNMTAEDIMGAYVMGQTGRNSMYDNKDMTKVSMNIDHALRLHELPRVDLNDQKAVHKRINQYFEMCRDDGATPSLPSLSVALGITKNVYLNIENGRNKTAPQWLRAELEAAKTLLNALTEQSMLDGSMQAIPGIFVLKNNYGYRDQQDIVLTPGQQEEDIPEADLIAEANLLE